MKDLVAIVLDFLFTSDQNEHSMPQPAEAGLLQKLKQVLHGNEVSQAWQNKT